MEQDDYTQWAAANGLYIGGSVVAVEALQLLLGSSGGWLDVLAYAIYFGGVAYVLARYRDTVLAGRLTFGRGVWRAWAVFFFAGVVISAYGTWNSASHPELLAQSFEASAALYGAAANPVNREAFDRAAAIMSRPAWFFTFSVVSYSTLGLGLATLIALFARRR